MRLKTSLLILAALMICICGCEREAAQQANDPMAPDAFVLSDGKAVTCSLMTEDLLDGLDYHTWDGVLWPGIGGIMSVQPPTWPANSGFTLIVPHDALPSWILDPVNFSMSIPVYEEYENDSCLPLIIRLEPSDIPFQSDIEIRATWPPCYNDDPLITTDPDDWCWQSLDPDDTSCAHDVFWVKNKWLRIHYFTDHFSDWGTKPQCDPTVDDCGASG